MNYRLLALILCIVFILFFSCTSSQALTDSEKMKVFYKYDSMFFFGSGTKEQHLDVELGDPELKNDLSLISKEYQKEVAEAIKTINIFFKDNYEIITKYKEYVESFFKKNNKQFDNDNYRANRMELVKTMREELLPKLKYCIRCMFSIDDTQYIEVAKELGDGNYAKTLGSRETDGVYWRNILRGEYPYEELKAKHTNAAGNMKYEYWFYESNLKIRIVKQVRDEKGNYLGEIYMDYYKLDQYDKLFDTKGNPRNTKK